MKRNFLCGLIASVSMISIGAYADPVPDASSAALTSKGYVDDGLKYVYKVASGISDGAVKSLQNIVGAPANGSDPATGLVGDVEALQKTVGNETSGLVKRVTDLENSNGYTAGTGVKVTPGTGDNPSTIGLDVTTSANTTYVFKTDANGAGTWSEMEVADTWDPTFLTTP
ncbi:MAG: hypothetical protein IJL21_03095 [Alphaproteobacteria bacterium]|nr:hypothetical protein [Alphaproteobacteria bacterium]